MSLQDLAPINSQRAKQTAINTFTRYLSSEGVTMRFIASVLLGDTDGSVFDKLIDRFAVYLAFLEGRDRKYLAKNSIMSYYRQVKNWLLDSYPKNRHVIEKKLFKMAQTLEKHCMRRQDGGPTKKAPACTKRDLKILMDGIYYDASSEKDYQDAALLALMWFAFGRASDLAVVTTASLSVTADGVVFIRLIRIKTADEQGLSLYPDKDCFITCPLHALGIALAMQDSPSSQLLQHPETSLDNDDVSFAPTEIPLAEALMSCSDIIPPTSVPEKKTRKQDESMKMHGFVNRIVKSASEAQARAKHTEKLSSHSFRRGGAQHANGDPSLSAQWIFDRGSWNMTATNKAFAYVFNTATGDKQVSRVLSGWESNEKPFVATFSNFATATQHEMHKLCNLLFAASLEPTAVDMKLDVKRSCGGAPKGRSGEHRNGGDTGGETIYCDAGGNGCERNGSDGESRDDGNDKSVGICAGCGNIDDGKDKNDNSQEIDAPRGEGTHSSSPARKSFASMHASSCAHGSKRSRILSLRLVLDAIRAGGPFVEFASRLRQLTCSRSKPTHISAKTINATAKIVSIDETTVVLAPQIVDEALRWVASDAHKGFAPENPFDADSILPVEEMSIEILRLRVLHEQWNFIEFCGKCKLDEYCLDRTDLMLIRHYKNQIHAVAVPSNVIRIPGLDEGVFESQDAFDYARRAVTPVVVLLAVNFSEYHWCGVIIDCRERVVIVFDPLRSRDRIAELNRLFAFLSFLKRSYLEKAAVLTTSATPCSSSAIDTLARIVVGLLSPLR
ncbi:unnamed protein product [Phytophthora fragariaefolia]|uniref:Unnamed protein product n=1 Tax=Phytophthora fragariaefolia TaxID=1490495 RepID=A0A9W6U9U5_9STRA|nr:unnamed protein product [Phytophthora fragariaefolia]